ncbi:very short patch repair endonuclease [Nitrosospira sp. Nl5]|uniref:very short patch repair endonuclease n=1 Tax=Nitrosospira sp. Nl5 TaxID=200120 RepID=UPI000B86A3A1|nr:very short patch repair endonuclease [Nitrosospira sp. Nl5]
MSRRKFDTTPERSALMSNIRSKGNRSTEMAMVRLLKKHKITGWRRNSLLPGKPDFIFPKHRLALFVDGCFWHGCKTCGHVPKQNSDYWHTKFQMNIRRDRKVSRLLRAKGWTVLRVWEHSFKLPEQLAARLRRYLTTSEPDSSSRPSQAGS